MEGRLERDTAGVMLQKLNTSFSVTMNVLICWLCIKLYNGRKSWTIVFKYYKAKTTN